MDDNFSKYECNEALGLFLEGPNLDTETAFARAFAENGDVQLFFIRENAAYTDGRTIVVDPTFHDIYRNSRCIEEALWFLGWPDDIPMTPWRALKLVTRGLVIHECLHLLYSPLPALAYSDPDFTDSANARQTLATISNIVEDAYVEAAGASEYENAGFYLKFVRAAVHAATCDAEPPADEKPLVKYLNHMAQLLLFPVAGPCDPPPAIRAFVEKTEPLFRAAARLSAPQDRHECCKEICSLVAPLIPPDAEAVLSGDLLADLLPGHESHGGAAPPSRLVSAGRPHPVRRGLFEPEETESDGDLDQLAKAIQSFNAEEDQAESARGRKDRHTAKFGGNHVGASPLHKDIRIRETHPGVDRRMRSEYAGLCNRFRHAIDSCNARFLRLLRAQVPARNNRCLFGERLDSRRLADSGGRFWIRGERGIGVPDMAVLLLIDGSGSMDGPLRESAKAASVVLHEVLRKQGVEHAVAEHRAAFEAPEMDVNVLLDFAPGREEELNLLRLEADGDNRDGLALYWAERFIQRKTSCAHKWIVVLSDGLPHHRFDHYTGVAAIRDTALAARKIAGRGTGVVAVALGSGGHSPEALRAIYPETVICRNPGRLAEQLLQILSAKLQ